MLSKNIKILTTWQNHLRARKKSGVESVTIPTAPPYEISFHNFIFYFNDVSNDKNVL
jgi:hypothetical protein